jgi:hypothetical protein
MTRNLFFCKEWAASFLTEHKGKKISSPIRVVNFCKTFFTYSPSSLGQDITIKKFKKFKKIHLGFMS